MTNTLLSETGFWREKHKSPKSILINFKKLNTSPQIKKKSRKEKCQDSSNNFKILFAVSLTTVTDNVGTGYKVTCLRDTFYQTMKFCQIHF